MYEILSGNALEVVKQIDKPVQLIVSSPPYYRMRKYGIEFQWLDGWYGELGQESSPELYTQHLADVFDVCREKITDTGVLFLNLGDTFSGGGKGRGSGRQLTNEGSGLDRNSVPNGYKQKDLLMIPHMVAAELRKRGWYLRAEIPWICPNKMPGPWKDRPIIGHEWFFMFTKSAKCSYDGSRVSLPAKYAEEHARKSTSWGTNRKHPNKNNVEKYAHTGDNHTTSEGGTRLRRTSDWFTDSLGYSIEELEDHLAYLKSVRDNGEQLMVDDGGEPMALIVNNRASSLKHFAMYNERLITPLIQSSTVEGDWVLDPFSGSGTTGRVALSMGRNYIGVEAKQEYIEISRKTLDDLMASMPEDKNDTYQLELIQI